MDKVVVYKLFDFYEYLKNVEKWDLSMSFGLDVLYSKDIERNLHFDISLNKYKFDEETTELLKKKANELNIFIFNYDFNLFCVLNKPIIIKYSSIDKVNKIVFDSSTFKFLNNIKIIGILYYLILQQNGSIYIESNRPISMCHIITDIFYLDDSFIDEKKEGFVYQSIYGITSNFLKQITGTKYDNIKRNIINVNDIYTHNKKYFEKWFYGSTVELLEDNNYPINNSNYPITKYYKITKNMSHCEILEHVKNNIEMYNDGLTLNNNSIILYQ